MLMSHTCHVLAMPQWPLLYLMTQMPSLQVGQCLDALCICHAVAYAVVHSSIHTSHGARRRCMLKGIADPQPPPQQHAQVQHGVAVPDVHSYAQVTWRPAWAVEDAASPEPLHHVVLQHRWAHRGFWAGSMAMRNCVSLLQQLSTGAICVCLCKSSSRGQVTMKPPPGHSNVTRCRWV